MSDTTTHDAKTNTGKPKKTVAARNVGPSVKLLKQGEGVRTDEERDARKKKPTAAERKLGGKYRLIHGRIAMPRPESERLHEDGSLNPNVQPTMYVEMGAEIELNDEEAARLEDAGMIEPLSVGKGHSRLGKVWNPPTATRM